MKNALAPGGYSNEVAHMPFARAALERSLTRLAHDSVSLPAFQEGYEQWKAARELCRVDNAPNVRRNEFAAHPRAAKTAWRWSAHGEGARQRLDEGVIVAKVTALVR